MGLFDFLTNSGSSLPQSQQQGLPPQHSTAARILELLGGFTGIMPLAGLGYLADQPTEERYNEKVWPRIRGMLKDSGVPEQKLADLELLPMSARVGPANQLWQASLKQKQQGRQQFLTMMGPGRQEETVDPFTGKVLAQLPQDFYSPSFKPKQDKPPNEKILTGGNAELAQQLGVPLDVSKQTPEQAARWNAALTKLDLSRQKAPQAPPAALYFGTSDSGNPFVSSVSRPRGVGMPTVSPPVSLPGLPKGKTATGAPKFPSDVTKDYTIQRSVMNPEAYLLTPSPSAASGGMFSYPKKPLLFYKGQYYAKDVSGKWQPATGE